MFFIKPLLFVLLLFSTLLPDVVQKTSEPVKSAAHVSSENDSSLLEFGAPRTMRPLGVSNGQIKVVSYNIRYRSGKDLEKLLRLFKEDPEIGNAVILGLQEVDRHKMRTDKTNTAKIIAEELGMNYAWAAPPTAKPTDEEETGVAIMSPFPITNVRRMVLPHNGPNQRRRVALGATVRILDTDVRVYSMHGETRIAVKKKLDQMSTLLADMKRYPENMPVILVGDLNTWESDAAPKTIKLFSDAGLHTPFDGQKTFSRRALFIPIEFRLDWIWLRGFKVLTFGIDKKINLSDHYPLWANLQLPTQSGLDK